MYEIFTANKKTEKRLREVLNARGDAREKLQKVMSDPRRGSGAHPLHGQLAGKWSCWLGSNVRMIYTIDDVQKRLLVEAVGTHDIY